MGSDVWIQRIEDSSGNDVELFVTGKGQPESEIRRIASVHGTLILERYFDKRGSRRGKTLLK
jgi:hypothetical protein